LERAPITIDFFNGQKITITIETTDLDTLLKESDFISLHVPVQENYVISTEEISKMKNGVGLINAARGGVVDEMALIKAIEKNKIKFAGLDVFEKEPNPEIQLLMNPELSLTPHIGAATVEAQDRIGTELASQVIKLLKE
jgi:D-3-phosphoglycerate dehydrogenase / 2-oxoglutarate reductase